MKPIINFNDIETVKKLLGQGPNPASPGNPGAVEENHTSGQATPYTEDQLRTVPESLYKANIDFKSCFWSEAKPMKLRTKPIKEVGRCEACKQVRHVARHHLITSEERDRMRTKSGSNSLPESAYASIILCGGCHFDLHCEFTNYELNRMTREQQIAAVLDFLSDPGSGSPDYAAPSDTQGTQIRPGPVEEEREWKRTKLGSAEDF